MHKVLGNKGLKFLFLLSFVASFFAISEASAKNEWENLNYSFVHSRKNSADGKSKLFVNISKRAEQEKADIENLNKLGMDVEDIYPGVWLELPQIAPNFFVFCPYYKDLPEFSIAGEVRVYQSVHPEVRLLATFKPEELNGIGNVGELVDLVSKTATNLDPYRAYGNVSKFLDDSDLPSLSLRRHKKALTWYNLSPNNTGLAYDSKRSIPENFGPGLYIEAIDSRPGQKIYYPQDELIRIDWVKAGRIAFYSEDQARGGVPLRIFTPAEIEWLANNKMKIGRFLDLRFALQFELSRPWRHYRIEMIPVATKEVSLTVDPDLGKADLRLPESLLEHHKTVEKALNEGNIESLLGWGVWVEVSPNKWIYQDTLPGPKQKSVSRLFPRHRLYKDTQKITGGLWWEDSEIFGRVDQFFVRSHFDPEKKEPARDVPTYTYGKLTFDTQNYTDYDREFGPGLWLEIPDDYLGIYVFLPSDSHLPDLSRFSRIRIYQEVLPGPHLIAEMKGSDFKARRFKNVDELAAFLITRDPDSADANRVLGDPPSEIMDLRFPHVTVLDRKNGNLFFSWLSGSDATLVQPAKTGGLPGYLIELPDRRAQRYVFYPVTEKLPDLNGLGRVRVYLATDLQGEKKLQDFPKPILEVKLSEEGLWPDVTLQNWVEQKLREGAAESGTSATTACESALKQIPQLPAAKKDPEKP